jgi:hypothetical protein
MTTVDSPRGPTTSEAAPNAVREFLRHTLATLAYRAEKVLRDAPREFGDFRVGPTSRTPKEIVAHLGDLTEWALGLAQGQHRWAPAPELTWTDACARFFDALYRLEKYLSSSEPLGWPAERLFQGPIADALTHTGQLAMLRRLAGVPVRGENYAKADIVAGRVGREQSSDRVEFD